MTTSTTALTPEQYDRARGALLGTAAGDALGAGYEFTHPGPGAVIEMRGGGPFDWSPGEWTDDTSMAIEVARGLAPGAVDLDAVAGGFMRWYQTGPPDIGNQTRAVLSTRPADARTMSQAAAAVSGRKAGNGSLMRTAAVGVAFVDDPADCADAAAAVSDLTHFDPQARQACQMWSVAIAEAVRTGTLDGPRRWLTTVAADVDEYWSALLDAAESGAPQDFANNGWVVHAVQTAWWAITTTGGDLPAALVECVRAGNDTDTTAAIAGALLGAARGAHAIPQEWVAKLHGYPGYTAADLDLLTDRLVGRPSVTGER